MPPAIDPSELARELLSAAEKREAVAVRPSARDSAFDLASAYAVGAELTRLRRATGHKTVGLKVGYANKAVWRALKLETLVWAPMYDDTVHYSAPTTRDESPVARGFTRAASTSRATLSIERMISPKIEPEIVFRLARPIAGDPSDPAAVLSAVDWLALGFEVIDCPFPAWKFQPADFVAAFGLHAALVIGAPLPVNAGNIPALVDALPRVQIRLMKDDVVVAEGSGKNSLRSPALCLGELAAAVSRSGQTPLAAGDLVSSGTLTESQPIAVGEAWRVEVSGIELEPLAVGT
jgi:2-oxo-3-hexenedioate decarboxylase